MRKLWSYAVSNQIDSLSVSGDGKYVLVGTYGAFAYLLDSSGKVVLNLSGVQRTYQNQLYNVGLSYDAGSILAGTGLYNQAGQLISSFSSNVVGPAGYSTSTSPSGTEFSASSDSTVTFLKTGTVDGDIVWSAPFSHGVHQTRAIVTPDAQSVIVVSSDSLVSSLSAGSGKTDWGTMLSHPVIGFASSYNGSLVVATTSDGSLEYISHTGNVVRTISLPNLATAVTTGVIPQNVALPWDAHYVVVGDSAGTLTFLDANAVQLSTLSVFSSPISGVGVSSNGQFLALTSGSTIDFFGPGSAQSTTTSQTTSVTTFTAIVVAVRTSVVTVTNTATTTVTQTALQVGNSIISVSDLLLIVSLMVVLSLAFLVAGILLGRRKR